MCDFSLPQVSVTPKYLPAEELSTGLRRIVFISYLHDDPLATCRRFFYTKSYTKIETSLERTNNKKNNVEALKDKKDSIYLLSCLPAREAIGLAASGAVLRSRALTTWLYHPLVLFRFRRWGLGSCRNI